MRRRAAAESDAVYGACDLPLGRSVESPGMGNAGHRDDYDRLGLRGGRGAGRADPEDDGGGYDRGVVQRELSENAVCPQFSDSLRAFNSLL